MSNLFSVPLSSSAFSPPKATRKWTVSPEFGDALLTAMREQGESGGPIPSLPSLLELPLPSTQASTPLSVPSTPTFGDSDHTRMTMKTRVAVRDKTPHRFQVVPLRDAGKHQLLPAQKEVTSLFLGRKQNFSSAGSVLQKKLKATGQDSLWKADVLGGGLQSAKLPHPLGSLGRPVLLTSSENLRLPESKDSTHLNIATPERTIPTPEYPSFDLQNIGSYSIFDLYSNENSADHTPTATALFPAKHTLESVPKASIHTTSAAPRVTTSTSHESTRNHNRSWTHLKSPSLGNIHTRTKSVTAGQQHEDSSPPRVRCRKRTNTLSAADVPAGFPDMAADGSSTDRDIQTRKLLRRSKDRPSVEVDPLKRHALYMPSILSAKDIRHSESSISVGTLTPAHSRSKSIAVSKLSDPSSGFVRRLNTQKTGQQNDDIPETKMEVDDPTPQRLGRRNALGFIDLNLSSDFPSWNTNTSLSSLQYSTPKPNRILFASRSSTIMKNNKRGYHPDAHDRSGGDSHAGVIINHHPIILELLAAVDLAMKQWQTDAE